MGMFDDYENELRAAAKRAEVPGTAEYAEAQTLARWAREREAAKLATSLNAGLVVGVTCTEKGEPLDLSPDDDEEGDEDDEE